MVTARSGKVRVKKLGATENSNCGEPSFGEVAVGREMSEKDRDFRSGVNLVPRASCPFDVRMTAKKAFLRRHPYIEKARSPRNEVARVLYE